MVTISQMVPPCKFVECGRGHEHLAVIFTFSRNWINVHRERKQNFDLFHIDPVIGHERLLRLLKSIAYL